MKKNKMINGILPMFLMNFSIGAVYCWTLFRDAILDHTGFSQGVFVWCFSLAMFFSGMAAAFGGKIVEKDVKLASYITFFLFVSGWTITGFSIYHSIPAGAIIGFGVIQGMAVGIGYLTPIKTLMLWMDKKQGFAAGLAITGFTLTGILLNPLIGLLLENFTVYHSFFILTAIFAVCLLIACLLIYRPDEKMTKEELSRKSDPVMKILFSKRFISLWFVLFINIVAGLAIISHERQIYETLGYTSVTLIIIFCNISVVFNLAGRMAMASWQDRLKSKHIPYYCMAAMSILACIVAVFFSGTLAVILGAIWTINFFFGCGYSCLPGILKQHYGIKQLATVHGLTLSAWAIAGLVGNQIAAFVMFGDMFQANNLAILFGILAAMFVIMGGFLLWFVKSSFTKTNGKLQTKE